MHMLRFSVPYIKLAPALSVERFLDCRRFTAARQASSLRANRTARASRVNDGSNPVGRGLTTAGLSNVDQEEATAGARRWRDPRVLTGTYALLLGTRNAGSVLWMIDGCRFVLCGSGVGTANRIVQSVRR